MDSKDDKANVVMDDNVSKTVATGQEFETARVLDKAAERRLCLKFDIRLMPVLSLMCKSPCLVSNVLLLIQTLDLFNALDKGNLGNAQTAGLSEGRPTSTPSTEGEA
ncbi:hypothetical protein IMZ48_08335 [Candidatus Bathyarchaeota archaeon]|nr:hypothetical protein [Candidatus Bathyarchaeota archaeon]